MSVLEHVPIFMIRVGDEILSQDIMRRITSFEYEDCEKEIDECRIRIADSMALIDSPLLREGSIMRLRWGYPGRLSDEKVCTIKAPEVSFGEDGVSLNIIGYDLAHRLTGRKVKKAWNNVSVQEVVETIAKKHNLQVKSRAVSDPITEMQASSDMQFLREISARYGYKTYVEAETLHFHPEEKSEAPIDEFLWGERFGRFLGFNVRVDNEDKKGQKSKVKARGINPNTKELQEVTLDQSNVGEPRLTGAYYDIDSSMGETPLDDREESGDYTFSPEGTPDDVRKRARKKYKNDNVKADASFIGDPRLRAKQILLLQGVGNAYSGNWYVTKMMHRISQGYTCSAELVREGPGNTLGGIFKKSTILPNIQLPKQLTNGKFQSFKNKVVTYLDGEEVRLARRFGEYLEGL